MNESNNYSQRYAGNEATGRAADVGAEVDACVRRNPGASVLAAVGIGLVLGILARGLRPEPKPQHRIAEFLEDLEDRLRHATAPALRKASALASEGAEVLGDRLNSGEAHLDHMLRKATRRVRGLWS